MDEKKKPANGTFTQVPNVFLDTCDLPETAQILYLRLLRKYGYKGGRFVGSIRELSKIVRYSKSTTDRLTKKLRDAGLINIEHDDSDIMIVTVNTDDLWALNKHHCEVQASQIWDSKLPSVPGMGQSSPKNGTFTASQTWDKTVPGMGQNRAQGKHSNTNNTFTNTNKTTSFSSRNSSPLVDEKKRQQNIELLRAGRKDTAQDGSH